MGGGGGRTETRTVQQQQPPQLLPESKEGYEKAQAFYKGIVDQPPVFPGNRLAPVSPTYLSSLEQGKEAYGRPTETQQLTERQMEDTLAGRYYGSEGAAAVESLARPVFRRYQSEILPGVRDRGVFAGHNVGAPRRQIGEQVAQEQFVEDLVRSAIAPVFLGERERQMEAVGNAPKVQAGELLRLSQLGTVGQAERALGQEQINVAREIFEEPLFRQSEAAGALLQNAPTGPGSATGRGTSREFMSGGQEAQQWITTLATIAMIAAAFASRRELKTNIIDADGETILNDLATIPVSTWRYNEEPEGVQHVGPMVEDVPTYLKAAPDSGFIFIPSFVGALLVAVQVLEKRIKDLEHEIHQLRQ